ncbi:MFS transporter [Agromyces sp. CF514]|uniref:MFS transporter n=1 Tax=Agromyces sp. CF514 TaxID=1881031 RepID=UPI0015A5D9CB|nr:MFS transporter [Agromyces sp. CF514]
MKPRDRTSGRVLALGVSTGFVTIIDQAAFSFAVPGLRDDLGADAGQVQWLVAGYSLAFGAALLPGGRLGDVFGRRVPYLVGLLLFAVGGVIAAGAGDANTAVVARLVQGLGAGLVNPQVLGYFQDLFTGPARAKALGAYTVAGSIAGLVSPPAAGWILATAAPGLGWRFVVLLSVPVALALFVVGLAVLPSGRSRAAAAAAAAAASASRGTAATRGGRDSRGGLDLVGLALLMAAILALMMPVTAGVPGGPLWLVVAAIAGLAFTGWERRVTRRGGSPVLDPALVRSRGFMLGTGVATLIFGAGLGLGIVSTLYLIDGLGLPALTAALLLAPRALGMALGSMQSWRVATRFGRRGITFVLAAGAMAVAVEAALVSTGSEVLVLIALVGVGTVHGVLYGLAIPSNQTLTLDHAPAHAAGVGAGVLALTQRLAGAVCLAVGIGLFLAAPTPAAGFATAAAVFAALSAAAVAISAFDRAPVRVH